MLIVVFAAVITPSGDPFSMLALAVPMYVFYEVSIAARQAPAPLSTAPGDGRSRRPGTPSRARPRCRRGSGSRSTPSRRRALDALDEGRSVLVSAPTGSGKTVVADYAVARARAEGRRAFYTTPLKALSNQKFAELVEVYGADARGAAHR